MRWMVGSDRPDSVGELALVDAEQRPRGAQLGGGDHVFYIKIDVWNVYNCCCGMRTTIHCKLQTKTLPRNDPLSGRTRSRNVGSP